MKRRVKKKSKLSKKKKEKKDDQAKNLKKLKIFSKVVHLNRGNLSQTGVNHNFRFYLYDGF